MFVSRTKRAEFNFAQFLEDEECLGVILEEVAEDDDDLDQGSKKEKCLKLLSQLLKEEAKRHSKNRLYNRGRSESQYIYRRDEDQLIPKLRSKTPPRIVSNLNFEAPVFVPKFVLKPLNGDMGSPTPKILYPSPPGSPGCPPPPRPAALMAFPPTPPTSHHKKPRYNLRGRNNPTSNNNPLKRRNSESSKHCQFCKSLGQTPDMYNSHSERNPANQKAICPLLRKLKCENCGETGDRAHSESKCPLNLISKGRDMLLPPSKSRKVIRIEKSG